MYAMPNQPASPSETEHYAQAQQFLAQDRLVEAKALLLDLESKGARLPEVYCDLAALTLQEGDAGHAKDLLKKALEIDPTMVTARRRLTFLYGIDHQFDLAFATISPLLRARPTHSDDIELLKKLLEATPELPPITWARLLADLKTPSEDTRRILDCYPDLEVTCNRLRAEKIELQNKIDLLTGELRMSGNTGNSWERINRLSIDEWQQVLLRSVGVPSYRGFPLPGFPPEALQALTVGSSNETALMEGFNFYRAVTGVIEKRGLHLSRDTPLLDFGTGWGRYARIFMHDVHPDHITGADVMPNMVETCRSTFPYANFQQVPALPPSDLPANHYQLIIAYSVFSHLSQQAATAWIKEFARILAPGGMIAITTQGRRFLKVCEEIRLKGQPETPWHENLARSFIDRAACEAAYDRGEHLFSATGGGDALSSTFYGEALVPEGFVTRHWTPYLDLVEFNDDGRLPQALIVMRKPA